MDSLLFLGLGDDSLSSCLEVCSGISAESHGNGLWDLGHKERELCTLGDPLGLVP